LGGAPGGAEGIVNGEETGFARWRGVVALVGEGGSLCTATLVHPEVAVTAAHCVYYPPWEIDYVAHPEDVRVLAAADVLADMDAAHVARLAEAVAHPSWEGDFYDQQQRDLAMVRLDEAAVDLDVHAVRAAPSPEPGDTATIVGYGPAGDEGVGIHRDGEAEIVYVDERSVLAQSGAGACPGDSGGPLFTDQDGEPKVTAVMSLSDCAAFGSTTSMNLVSVRDWVSEVLEGWTGSGLPRTDAGVDTGADSGPDAALDASDGDASDAAPTSSDTADGDCDCAAAGSPPRTSPALLASLLAGVGR